MTDLQEVLERCLQASFEVDDYDPAPIFRQHPSLERELSKRWETLRRLGMVGRGPAVSDHPSPTTRTAGHDADLIPAGLLGERYRCKEELGHGGMGRVLLADDLELGREVAIKLVDLSSASLELRHRLLREARVHARLEHPAIAPVHDLGVEVERYAYLVMKRVAGQTLSELLAQRAAGDADVRRRLAPPRVVEICRTLCDALAFAHDRGVVHRDLKPANVMVGMFGEVQLLDWGIARVLGEGLADDAAAITPSDSGDWVDTLYGMVIGTPSYMAPEQARGEVDAIDARTDVFGLGALLHHLLAGRPPYWGRDKHEVMARAREGRRNDARMRQAGEAVPRELIAICERALQPESERRYETVSQVRADLDAFLEGRGGLAWRDRPHQRFVKWVARRPGLAASLAALAITGLLGSLLWKEAEARSLAELRTLYMQIDRNAESALQQASEEFIENRHEYDLAALSLIEWLRDAGMDLFDREGTRRQVEDMRASTEPLAVDALDGLTRVYLRIAYLLSLAGAPQAAGAEGIVPPAERDLRLSSARHLEEAWKESRERSPQIAAAWEAVEDLAPIFNDTPWRRAAWEFLGSMGRGQSKAEHAAGIESLFAGADELELIDVDWLAQLRGRSGNTMRVEFEQLSRVHPDSAGLTSVSARVRRNDATFHMESNPDDLWSALRRRRHGESYARAALALSPDSTWSRLNHAEALGGIAEIYLLMARECDRHTLGDSDAELAGSSAARMTRLAREYRGASLDFRNREILTLRQAVGLDGDTQARIWLLQALARFLEDHELEYDPGTRAVAPFRGLDVEEVERDVHALLADICVLLKDDAEARTLTGLVRLRTGDVGAIEAFRSALDLAPDDLTALEWLAVALARRFERDGDRVDCEESLDILDRLEQLEAGEPRYRSRRIRLLRRAVRQFPERRQYRLRLAEDLLGRSDRGRRAGDLQEAEDILQRLIESDHESDRCRSLLERAATWR